MNDSRGRNQSLLLRLFERLLNLYPPRFRVEFSAEIRSIILSRMHEVEEIGRTAWFATIFQEALQLIISIIHEHWHELGQRKENLMVQEVKFVINWTIATTISAFLALIISQIFLFILGSLVQFPNYELVFGCFLGLFLGIGQWWALHWRLTQSGRWILSSLIGGIVVGLVANLAGNHASSLTTFGAYGIIIGAFQWLVLRGRLRSSGIWILASGVAWALGSQSIVLINRMALDSSWLFNELITVAIIYGLLGMLVGVITGAIMVWIIRNIEAISQTSTNRAIA